MMRRQFLLQRPQFLVHLIEQARKLCPVRPMSHTEHADPRKERLAARMDLPNGC